ncbi:IS110 family transposase [Streptomyces sp. NPDC056291]|uniref:IS110 family transposase n=1 Tax=unclassified Streptomyces TaxID=2593676 RepID=UPI0035D9EC59
MRTPCAKRPGTWTLKTERFAILNALIDGERDPRALAELAIRRARSKIPALVEALDGTFTEHHAFMCRHYLGEIDHLAAVADQLDARITALLARLERNTDVENLDSIPGIGPAAAQIIIAEIGGDMAQFATAGHLASWIGVCPGIKESAGVAKSGRTRPGNSNLKRLLGIAAMSVSRSKDGYLSAYYRRIAARRGRQRALVAVMHKLAVAIWHILRNKTRTRTSAPTASPAATPNAPCTA